MPLPQKDPNNDKTEANSSFHLFQQKEIREKNVYNRNRHHQQNNSRNNFSLL